MIIFTDFFTLKTEHSLLRGRYPPICTDDVRQTNRGRVQTGRSCRWPHCPLRDSSSQEKCDEGPGGNDTADSARQGPGLVAWPAQRPRPPGGGEAGIGLRPLPSHLCCPDAMCASAAHVLSRLERPGTQRASSLVAYVGGE